MSLTVTIQRCRSCGAEIIWCVTSKGKKMPVDAEPEMRVVMIADNRKKGQVNAHMMPTHTSHFATCPNADDHRSKPHARQENPGGNQPAGGRG